MRTFSKALLLTSIVAAITFAGCKKETPEPTPTPTPTPIPTPSIASLNAFFASEGAQSQFFTINNNTTQTVTGTNGTYVGFNPNSFVTMSGAPVTGNITIELKEIYTKKNMLLSNMPTNAVHYIGGPQEPLISAGEFYIHAKQGTADLKLAPGQTYNVFLPSATTPDPLMSLFDGEFAADTVQWIPNVDSAVNITVAVSPAPQGYFATCDSLDWGNADRFLNNPNYTTITMNIAGTFDPTQVSAFVWYDNVNTVWSCWDSFNSTANTFTDSHTASGLPAHLIVISVKDGVLYTGIIAATITTNGVYTITLTASDETAFGNALSTLP